MEHAIDHRFHCPCGLCRAGEDRTAAETRAVRLIPRLAGRTAAGGDGKPPVPPNGESDLPASYLPSR
jgi:hypothetical protein